MHPLVYSLPHLNIKKWQKPVDQNILKGKHGYKTAQRQMSSSTNLFGGKRASVSRVTEDRMPGENGLVCRMERASIGLKMAPVMWSSHFPPLFFLSAAEEEIEVSECGVL